MKNFFFCLINRSDPMTQRDVRYLLKDGLLITLSLGASVLISFLEIIIVAPLGTTELAAVSMATAYFNIVFTFCLGIIVAITPIISKAKGAGRTATHLSLQAQTALILTILISLIGIILLSFASLIFPYLSTSSQEVALAKHYLFYAAPSLPFWCLFIAFRSLSLVFGHPQITSSAILLSVPFHIFFSWFSVHGLSMQGFSISPSLGVAGAGLGQSLGTGIMMLSILWQTQRSNRLSPLFKRPWQFSWPEMRQFLYLGLPMSCRILARETILPITTLMMAAFGDISLAVHALAFRIVMFASLFTFGISNAAIKRMSELLAQDHTDHAHSIFKITCRLSFISGILAVGITLIFSDLLLAYILGKQAETYPHFSYFFMSACCFILIDTIQAPINAALVARRDVIIPLFIFLFYNWILGLPLCYLLAHIILENAIGIWIGVVIATLLTTIHLYVRLYRRG